jgi:hypothetical protein
MKAYSTIEYWKEKLEPYLVIHTQFVANQL